MEVLWTALVSATFTFFELERTFFVPPRARQRLRLWALWWGFVILNAIAGCLLYSLVRGSKDLATMDPEWRALAVGGAYVGLARLKLASIPYRGQEIPFGFELLYNELKEAVFKRINRIAADARAAATEEMAKANSLAELTQKAKLKVQADELLSDAEKAAGKTWILEQVTSAQSAEDFDTKAALSDYLVSGRLPIAAGLVTE